MKLFYYIADAAYQVAVGMLTAYNARRRLQK